jgi:non-specific serine/threonine protein kinase/serine/threonine-protein kinase
MGKTSVFDLDPERLNQLFAIGKENGDVPYAELSEAVPEAEGKAEELGSWVGRYRLLGILGEGGMGIVYLAQQEHPIQRQVALKVIKPGMDTRRVIARFEAERQTLAMLDHPNIAHIHDAGTTKSGRPFFVMEHVEGLPITDHCDRNKLSLKERLRLFEQVCQAIHHAHQKGIIHRDIKPSNILVATQEDRAIPKVIDFGVARAIKQPLTERTLSTEQGQLVGTPEYMSPEQLDLVDAGADTRSDVYSLGVLLYVLLAGALPFESETVREQGLEHLRRIAREQDPKPPSTRLTSLGEKAAEIARNRRTDVRTLAKDLRNELEWIPLKAMAKDREQRYRSAAELADDIRNYLDHAPLVAGPPSGMYRICKFLRRHRNPAIGTAALLAALIAGTVVSTLFAIQAREQARAAAAINAFFNGNLLDSLSPGVTNVGEATVYSVLDTASQNLKDQFKDQPLVEASIRQTLANSYLNLGDYTSAEKHQSLALQLRREHLGERHLDTLDSVFGTAALRWHQARYDEAEQLGLKVLDTQKRLLGSEHTSTLLTMNLLGLIHREQGRFDDARQLLEQTVNIARRVLGNDHEYTLLFTGNLAHVYRRQSFFREAEVLVERILPAYQRAWGEEHPHTLDQIHLLGMLYSRHKDPADALPLLLKELDVKRRVLGESHHGIQSPMDSIAKIYTQKGLYDQAEPLALKSLEISMSRYGEESLDTFWAMKRLAALRAAQKRYDDAETLLKKAIEGWRKMVGKAHPDTLSAQSQLGGLYIEQSRYDQAEPLVREVFESATKTLGKDHRLTLTATSDLGAVYTEQGRFSEAEPLLLQAVEGRALKFGEDHPDTLASRDNLVSLYDAWGKPDEAQKWRAKLVK